MPPSAKITREMIIQAGLDVVRAKGAEGLNARKLAEKLGCSTQPVMYHYRTMEALRADVYAAADQLHTEALMRLGGEHPMLSIGLNYLRFAREEPNLFRFLFQTDQFRGRSLGELLSGEAIGQFAGPLAEAAGISLPQAETVFRGLFAATHGLASLLANNAMVWDEEGCAALLADVYEALVSRVSGKGKDESAP